MRVKIKLIPEDGPAQAHEFESLYDASAFLLKECRLEQDPQMSERVLNRDEEAAERLKNGFETQYVPGFGGDQEELSPAEPERPGFIKRLFGVR